MGLGPYIAGEIANGHDGYIDARSDETETVFMVTNRVHWVDRTHGAAKNRTKASDTASGCSSG